MGGGLLYNWIGDARLIVLNGMVGATGNIYVGLMEYEDMSFLLHYLQKDDTFFDIGANVGVYTILASKVKEAKSISVEPLPSTYEKLIDNININRLKNTKHLNIGLANEKSKLYFTSDKDTMNSVATKNDKNKIEVEVDTLDNLSITYGSPKSIKIDVEGYERKVLSGAEKTLQDENLEVVILELNGSGKKFGFSDDDIHNYMKDYGFLPYSYNPFKRNLSELSSYGKHNTIYIRKNCIESIKEKVINSEAFNVNGINL